MSKARQLIEGAAAPTEAPPTEKPGTKTRPAPTPSRRPSPWRRKHIKPGEEPRPKACVPHGASGDNPY